MQDRKKCERCAFFTGEECDAPKDETGERPCRFISINLEVPRDDY